MADLIHATAIAYRGRAALIRGRSGSGKSDLALRCLCLGTSPLLPEPARLVSDDQVLLEKRSDGLLWAEAPQSIRGKLEVRGLGILEGLATSPAPVVLILDLVSGTEVDRMPDENTTACISGVDLPLLKLSAFEASAPVKLLLALARAVQGQANLKENPLR